MDDQQPVSQPQDRLSDEKTPLEGRSLNRREFLKMAGIAGATIGVGAGLTGFLAGCGGEETTTRKPP